MKKRYFLFGVVAALGGAAVLAATARAQERTSGETVTLARFPNVEGKNLEGMAFKLPSGFAGKRNLVFVAFQREQQDDVDTWVPLAKELTDLDKNLRYYEVPTLSRMNGLIRAFIDGGMKAGIPDKAAREATITVYIDKAPFRKALGIANESAILTLIVDREGAILWRAAGKMTKEKEADLRRFIRSKMVEERLAAK